MTVCERDEASFKSVEPTRIIYNKTEIYSEIIEGLTFSIAKAST